MLGGVILLSKTFPQKYTNLFNVQGLSHLNLTDVVKSCHAIL